MIALPEPTTKAYLQVRLVDSTQMMIMECSVRILRELEKMLERQAATAERKKRRIQNGHHLPRRLRGKA